MSYQVLYRKYRPSRFADVVGQPQVTETLKNEIKSGRIAHAYLFTGSRGTGKSSCAKILAAAVNCLSPEDGGPCGKCEICRGIEDGSVVDVVEMDAASNNGVGDVRDLQEALAFTPAKAKYRVYIIDEVHMMSGAAFNALLKTLEEPPAHVIFILATTEVHKLPATILSRCQRHDFGRISPEGLAGRLSFIAEHEGAAIDPDAALLIARIADGGMRDAISILDQCLSRVDHVDEQTVRDAAGLAGNEHIFALSQALAKRDAAAILGKLSELHAASKDMGRLCEELIAHYRGIMIIGTVKRPENLIIATKTEMKELISISKKYDIARVMDIINSLQASLERMGRGVSRRTELETAFLRLCREDDSGPGELAALADRIASLERQMAQGFTAAPSAARPVKTAPLPNREVAALSDSAVAFEPWSKVMEKLEARSASLFAVLRGSSAYQSGDYLLVDAADMAVDMLRQETARETLKAILQEETGQSLRLGPYRPSERQEKKADGGADLIRKRAEQAGILGVEN